MRVEPFPLHWPDGWARTPDTARGRAPFDRGLTIHEAMPGMLRQLRLLGGDRYTLSSNVPLRADGVMRADKGQPADPGVALWFQLEGEQRVMACDRWVWVQHNLRAIERTIEAQRGIDRWGVGSVERAMSAYVALSPPRRVLDWWELLGVSRQAPMAVVEAAYRALVKAAHTDSGGDGQGINDLQAAVAAARAERVGVP